jgi:NADP-dependent 3-hydroxy acid dehydrogenase YdfG
MIVMLEVLKAVALDLKFALDDVVNAAQLTRAPQAPLERLKVDEWDRMIDVNIKGVLYCASSLYICARMLNSTVSSIARRAIPSIGSQPSASSLSVTACVRLFGVPLVLPPVLRPCAISFPLL